MSTSPSIELTTTSSTSSRRGQGQAENSRRYAPRRTGSAGNAEESGLESLPLELQYLIISHLDLTSLITLRETCPLYRQVITADVVGKQFTAPDGGHYPVLQSCCTECLCMPGLDRLIIDTTRPSHMWRSICFRCWRYRMSRENQRKHWPLVQMVNGDYGYICHFCTWPVHSGGSSSRIKNMHAPCRVRRLVVVISWLIMAIIQFGLGMLAAVLAWTMFRNTSAVLIPATVCLSSLSLRHPSILTRLLDRFLSSGDSSNDIRGPCRHHERSHVHACAGCRTSNHVHPHPPRYLHRTRNRYF